MPKNNFVYLKGQVVKKPYFGQVARRGDSDEKKPFLQFYLDVPRDRTQPSLFASDSIRVVMYGDQATALYPRLRDGLALSLIGWVQHRIFKRGTVTEIVAEEVQIIGQPLSLPPPPLDLSSEIANGSIMAQLQDLARRRGLDVSNTVKFLLTSYLEQNEQADD